MATATQPINQERARIVGVMLLRRRPAPFARLRDQFAAALVDVRIRSCVRFEALKRRHLGPLRPRLATVLVPAIPAPSLVRRAARLLFAPGAHWRFPPLVNVTTFGMFHRKHLRAHLSRHLFDRQFVDLGNQLVDIDPQQVGHHLRRDAEDLLREEDFRPTSRKTSQPLSSVHHVDSIS